jgi:hypothetical protein
LAISERKLENNPAMSWQPAGTYCLNIMMISEIISLKSVILAHFFYQNLYMSHTQLFFFIWPSGEN